jgi:hypothetical protein
MLVSENGALDAKNYFAPKSGTRSSITGRSPGSRLAVRSSATAFFFADYEGTRADEGITNRHRADRAARGAIRAPHASGWPRRLACAAPNRPGQTGNFVTSPQRDDTDHFDVRSDAAFGRSFDVMARYSFADRRLFEPFSGPAFPSLPGYGNDVARRGQNGVVSLTHILSPALLNETRVAVNRVSSSVFPEQGSAINRAVGLPEPWPDSRDAGLSLITVTGYSPLGHEYNNPQASTTNTIHIADTLTWTRGNHLVKAGFDAGRSASRHFATCRLVDR